jgi:hypothetical protein
MYSSITDCRVSFCRLIIIILLIDHFHSVIHSLAYIFLYTIRILASIATFSGVHTELDSLESLYMAARGHCTVYENAFIW